MYTCIYMYNKAIVQEFVGFKQTMECTVKLTELNPLPATVLDGSAQSHLSTLNFSTTKQALAPIKGADKKSFKNYDKNHKNYQNIWYQFGE